MVVTQEDDLGELGRMLENSKLDVEEQVRRAINEDEETNGKVSGAMNIYHGMLSDSRSQSENHPRLLMYAHSSGFEAYESGLAKVTGRRPSDEIAPLRRGKQTYRRDSDVNTDYIPLEVLPEEAMPVGAAYEGEGVPEVVLEHGELDMQEGRQVTFQVQPYDPGDITGSNWQDNLQDYEEGDVRFRRSGS